MGIIIVLLQLRTVVDYTSDTMYIVFTLITKWIMVDYKGQILAERYAQFCFAIICAPAWLYGYYQQDFMYPLYAWAFATVLATLVSYKLCVCRDVSSAFG